MSNLEIDNEDDAKLRNKNYTPILNKEFQWQKWAVPKNKKGEIDHHKIKTGDDLKEFVDFKLFPYLKTLAKETKSSDSIEYKIGEIFNELKNKIQSGYVLAQIIELIDKLSFQKKAEKDEMSYLYETKIRNMVVETAENTILPVRS